MKQKQKATMTEVKYTLDSARALCGDFSLSEELKSFFRVTESGAHMRIWYVDTMDQALHNMGWSVRYRYHDDCDFELTYKKRFSEKEYKLVDEKTTKKLSKEFEPEIDHGVSKKTYSFSYIKRFAMNQELYNLDISAAKHLAAKNSPELFTDWNGKNEGQKHLLSSCLYGPVYAMEYKGKHRHIDVSFEIWKLDNLLVELSFDVKTDKSDELYNELLSTLNKKRLVLPQKSFKTETLFNYYSKNRQLIKC